MRTINYRKVSEKEIKRVVPYLIGVLPQPVTEESFSWEFFKEEASLLTLAEEAGEIVGTQAFLPVKLNIQDRTVNTCKSETSYLNPAYRGHKIFEALYEYGVDICKKNKLELIWGFTPAAKAWKNNLKFDIVELCVYEINYESPEHLDYALLKKFSSNPAIYALKVLKHRLIGAYRSVAENRLLGGGSSKQLRRSAIFAGMEELGVFHSQLRRKYGVSVHLTMDPDFISWRIESNPTVKYRHYFYYLSGELCGYVVYTLSGDTLLLSEISYLSQEVMIRMIADLREEMRREKLYKLYYFGNKGNALNDQTFSFFEKLKAKVDICSWANFVLKDITPNKNHSAVNTKDIYINGLWTEGFKL